MRFNSIIKKVAFTCMCFVWPATNNGASNSLPLGIAIVICLIFGALALAFILVGVDYVMRWI